MKTIILFTFIWYISPTTSDVTFTNMSDNPGLYPLIAGTAQVKESDWTLIKTTDYTSTINDYLNLRINLLSIIKTLENKSFIFEHEQNHFIGNISVTNNNYFRLIKQYINRIDNSVEQIFPKINMKSKRSLVDGLGSIIKFLTGNLDASDGKRYENAILKLQQNKNLNTQILDQQTHILNETLNDLQILRFNQGKINSKLTRISFQNEEVIKLFHEFSIRNLLNEALFTLQSYLNVWNDLENALTFALKQQMHMSLLSNQDLISNLNQILSFLSLKHDNSLDLPYPVNLINLHLYENIIMIKAYQINNCITFIFEIPLITKHKNYQLIQLIPFPIHVDEHSYRMIVPVYTTILFNMLESIPIENDHCVLANPNNYFCHQKNHFKIPNDRLCELQLLSFHSNQTCTPYIFNLTDLKITQIDNSLWLLTTPSELIADVKCSDKTYRKVIKYSNSVHLTSDCSVLINHKNVLYDMKTVSNKHYSFQLPNINRLQINFGSKINVSDLDLTSFNTKTIVHDKLLLDKYHALLNSDHDNKDVHVYMSTLSVIIITIVLFIVISLIIYVYCKRLSLKNKLLKYINKNTVDNSLELAQSKI